MRTGPITFGMAAIAGLFAFGTAISAGAQERNFTAVRAQVDFAAPIRPWDGFGVNYVETAQTFDYAKWPQDYGGFRFLSEPQRQAIIERFFGEDGLRPAMIKMFLDPHHQTTPGGTFDHRSTTGSVRYFVREGLERTRARGDSLVLITTLYGPPAYMTRQKILRGRDLDPARREDLVSYLADWVRFLRETEGFPVRYVSLHNEGESWLRWPEDGGLGETELAGHDYNFFWPPEHVTELVKRLQARLDDVGLGRVAVTNGEPTNWYRFSAWGYADALYDDEEALKALGLITSHGFYVGRQEAGRWFGPHSGRGTDLLREKRPLLHAWTTSTAWDRKADSGAERQYVMDAHFVKEIHGNIYEAKVNGLIPWAALQNASQWNKPDPNPGTAIRVYDDGSWEVAKGYYYYKQVTRAGRPGMSVVRTSAMDSEIAIIGFGSNGTKNPDAVVVINFGPKDREIALRLKGSKARSFRLHRTTGQEVYEPRSTARLGEPAGENYRHLGLVSATNGVVSQVLPANSVTTLLAND